jgi:hypothetical protein
MKRNIFSILFLALSFTFLNTDQIKGTTILELSFNGVCQGSELIFEGRVVSKETHLSPATGNPFTYFTFEIIDVIKGSYTGSTIELGFMGGQKGDYVMSVSGMRMPELNEKGIYFVESVSKEQVHPLCGWHQGHYLVLSDPSNGKEKVVPVQQDPLANTVSQTVNEFKQAVREIIEKAR